MVPIFSPNTTPAPEVPQYEEYDNDYNEYDYNDQGSFQEPEQPPQFQPNPSPSPSPFQPINPEINTNNDYNEYDYQYYDSNDIEQGKYKK